MSLWDKWEKEKSDGREAKNSPHSSHHGDAGIRSVHPKVDLQKQLLIVVGAFFGCIAVVFIALTLEAMFNGRRWSDTYIVQLFAAREAQRESIATNR